MYSLCSIKYIYCAKDIDVLHLLVNGWGCSALFQEPQYSLTNEILTKATWILVHKTEQKFRI